MSRKILNIEHHLCSGCCMWSGIEDVYATMTTEALPEGFFFCMASSGENAFIKMKEKRMFSAGDGRTRVTYDHLKDIIGLEYHITEGGTLSFALQEIKKEIDQGRPVIIGPLDMMMREIEL